MDQCETNENTQLAITTKGFSAVCSVRLILAIYHTFIAGRAITGQDDPAAAAQAFQDEIGKYWA
ncbi:hypothetical protein BMS77_09360 [Leuconostoc pseudomesenteroides]|nr:hypothetical protein BMS77_09360 [Leuconostoc pseudomesenteroides]OQJ76074.1 hypothetical protein BMS82_08520 [Leuconostoc pseudomesenteroides]ORI44603.1 hypothetical protein BMR94_08800 [Leuconostoc pseudomesenteroides]ORI62461.1 hypothetical protein BMS71_08915 [Leuconostoc pseudomesenteroides]